MTRRVDRPHRRPYNRRRPFTIRVSSKGHGLTIDLDQAKHGGFARTFSRKDSRLEDHNVVPMHNTLNKMIKE